jgi:hypothetical protein
LHKSYQEHFGEDHGSHARQLANTLPRFVTTFTTQEIYMGSYLDFYFTVSDSDHNTLTVTKDASCPTFTILYSTSITNKHRLYISPPLTDFTTLGLNSCKLILNDGNANVEQTLNINVLNRAPYLITAISS